MKEGRQEDRKEGTHREHLWHMTSPHTLQWCRRRMAVALVCMGVAMVMVVVGNTGAVHVVASAIGGGHPYVYICLRLCVRVCVYVYVVCVSISIDGIYLSIYRSIDLSIYQSTNLSINQSIYLSIYICLSIYLSIDLSMHKYK
jgi:hypothetical protein